MHFNDKLIILLFSVVFENALCKNRYYLNDMCLTTSGINGICKPIYSCPSAVQVLKTQNIFPKTCGFEGKDVVVCCVHDTMGGAVAGESSTRISKPIAKKRPTIVSTSTEREIPQVGDRRQQNKCSTTSGINGICTLISSCPSALQALKTQNIFPKTCGFEGNDPLVCCVHDTMGGAVAGESSTRISKPSTKRLQTILSTSTERAIPQVGNKSKLNDVCSTASGKNGICKQIYSCPSALHAIRTQNIFPKTCSFEDQQPIICCVNDSTFGTVAGDSYTS